MARRQMAPGGENGKYYPDKQGFDVNVGGCEYGCPPQGYFAPWGIPTLQPEGADGDYLTDRVTDEAVKLIEQNAGEKPFFLNMCYYTVHCPIQAKPETIKKYEEKQKRMGLDKVKTFEEGDFFPCEHKKDKRIVRRLVQSDPTYAAMIEHLDENVGRLLAAIEKISQTSNTLVFFTSDNGGLATAEGSPTCNAPLAEGKGWMYEGGTREPLLAKWPGVIQPGTTCQTPVTTTDFYPTMLEAAGLPLIPEQHVDGVSIMPLLKGGDALEREAIFWHYPHYGNQGERRAPPCARAIGNSSNSSRTGNSNSTTCAKIRAKRPTAPKMNPKSPVPCTPCSSPGAIPSKRKSQNPIRTSRPGGSATFNY